jgi:hypothetical protein
LGYCGSDILREYLHLLMRMADVAHKLAPFESPRFAAIDYALREADLSQFTTDELRILEKPLSRAFGFVDAGAGDAGTTQH